MPIWPGVAKALIKVGLVQKLPAVRALMGDGLPFLKYYNRRVLGSPNVELRRTQQLIDRAQAGVIDLSLGAPPPLSGMVDGLPCRDAEASGYPSVMGMIALRRAIAEKLRRRNWIDIDPASEILVCNGVSQGIGLMLDAFVDRRDRVAVFDPSFFMYRLAAMNREARVVSIPTWVDAGRTRFNERALRRSLKGTKLLFLNSPNNPTGGTISCEDLERIAWWCRNYDVLVFSDEVYEDYLYEGEHASIGAMPGGRDRTITANSFSKSFGMAGFRVGSIAGSKHLIGPLTVSALAGAPFVAIPSQLAALAALQRPPDLRAGACKHYREQRDLASRRLELVGLTHEKPSGAFFIWANLGATGMQGQEFAEALLAEQNVLVMPGESSGSSGRDFVRISFAGRRADLETGLDRIAAFLERRVPKILQLSVAWPRQSAAA